MEAKAKGKKTKNGKTLVIVESPSKAKTIGKFLGANYKVIASVGHVRDLPKSKFGIDIEDDFAPMYINIRGKGDVIKNMKSEAKAADKVLLATDPDREGEAISWHIATLLGLDENAEDRIQFNEVTKEAIKASVKNPRKLDLNLVDAQQARRVLDRIVGYKLSPLLWRKIRPGLSAGRVQSAALKMICDREREIQAFIPDEFWKISVLLQKLSGGKEKFTARLTEKNGEKFVPVNKEQADEVLADLEKGGYTVNSVEKKERRRRPYAPFTTSTLQQDASSKLGFPARKTMTLAQQLYEGVTVKGRGSVGLVTYIRTDSVRVSSAADAAAKAFIEENYSKAYVGNNFFSNKKKEIQDAHEAIRPSYTDLLPDDIKGSLTPDQYKLYRLIWSRFIASRMSEALYDTVGVDVVNGAYTFRATGSKLRFDGFLKVYQTPDTEESEDGIPELDKGEELDLKKVDADQSFTQPPARFTEASLVKELEEKGIGRPSTFVPIIGTITGRGYIERVKKAIMPTEVGFVVTELMEQYFNEIVDSGFTSDMEDKLDSVETNGERGRRDPNGNVDGAESAHVRWQDVVGDFYGTLSKELDIADKEIEKVEVADEVSDEVCALCGKPMLIKQSRYGKFLACSGYPDCKNTKPIVVPTGVACPVCGKEIVERRSKKKGKIFYGCSGFPACKQVYWDKPVDRPCPKCGALLTEKPSKKYGTSLACSNTDCDYRE
ncbi:MAG: type I DNA topoisomerase [Clostridiales Family XIII bacterium]|jgi:DNA topoisomerase-1|nr:type I DNA topoisomerase [Clostridiales Family XIII bacterium]